VAACLSVVVLAVTAGCGDAELPRALGSRAGFAEGSTLLYRSDDELARELDGIAATGARWLRVDVDWDLVEHDRGQRDWSRVDRVIDAARARGLTVLGLLTYAPPWARPPGTTNKHPPEHVEDFAAFCAAAARRYAVAVAAWEIWNEPNLASFWEPAADPVAYARLLRAAASAIRTVAPPATIVSGGLAPSADGARSISPVRFLTRLYAAGARRDFDAVGHHPYNYPGDPLAPTDASNDNAFGGVTPALRDVMVSHGDAEKQIWGTETGAPTVGPRAPRSLAAHVDASYEAWNRWDFTGPLFWYSYRDAGGGRDAEDHFGLVTAALVPKGHALERFTELAGGG
jgi:hypothetical protein